MRKITKLFTTKATSVDENAKTIKFKISDNKPDRMNEVVDQSWRTESYMDNPIVLWGHDPDEPENVLGQAASIETDGGESYATVKLDEDINPKAGLVWKQLLRGTLRCVSVGFICHDETTEDGRQVLKDNELLEISIVAIPANPRAFALAFKEGSLNRKDITYLLDSMRKESAYLEKQLEPTNNEEDLTVNEAMTKQMAAMLDAIKKTNENVAALATVVEQSHTKGAISDVLDADADWDTWDEKYMMMRDVSDIYSAFCEAYYYSATPVAAFNDLLTEFIDLLGKVLDGSYSEGEGAGAVSKSLKSINREQAKEFAKTFLQNHTKSADTDPKPKTDAGKPADPPEPAEGDQPDKDKVTDDDSAKGGKDDQPGAETEKELDLDAELTPELKAQIDSALQPEKVEA